MRWTARGAYTLVGGTLVVLLAVVVVGLFGPGPEASVGPVVDSPGLDDPSVTGVLTAAGLIFFAFAGYARIATLAGEVVDPGRTLRRAIGIALGASPERVRASVLRRGARVRPRGRYG